VENSRDDVEPLLIRLHPAVKCCHVWRSSRYPEGLSESPDRRRPKSILMNLAGNTPVRRPFLALPPLHDVVPPLPEARSLILPTPTSGEHPLRSFPSAWGGRFEHVVINSLFSSLDVVWNQHLRKGIVLVVCARTVHLASTSTCISSFLQHDVGQSAFCRSLSEGEMVLSVVAPSQRATFSARRIAL
jgi:hypothetical protein